MRGTIDKRGDQCYRIRLHLGYDNGKRIRYIETVHGTRRDADARMRDLISEYERGALAKRSRKSVNEFLADWLDTVKNQVRARTHRDYAGLVERYIRPTIGKLPLDKLTTLAIQKLYNEMSNGWSGKARAKPKAGEEEQARSLSGRTVRRLHTVLNRALRQGVSWNLIPRNVATDVQLPRLKVPKVNRAMSVEQARAFFQATRGHRLGAMFRAAMEGGMRPQEYCALQWADIDWHTGLVDVNKAITWPKGGGWAFDEPKSEAGRRRVKFSPTAMADLREHRKAQLEQRLLLGPDWKGTGWDFVFTNRQGGPVSLVVLGTAFREILEAAGLPKTFRPYDMRHSSATLMLLGNVAPKVASERLGHSTIVLTLDTYSHVLKPMQDQASQVLGDLLHGV